RAAALPLACRKQTWSPPFQPRPARARTRSGTFTVKPYVLVVEDNREMQALLVDILQLMGLDVRAAGRGDDALVQMLREAPALVWLDGALRGMRGGIDVLTVIRNDVTLTATKVILLTAQHVAARMPEAEKADLIMLKPVDAEQLMLLAERLLQSRV